MQQHPSYMAADQVLCSVSPFALALQVNVNLDGPAHLNMQCNKRQQAFELDLTGSTLTFTVSRALQLPCTGCPVLQAGIKLEKPDRLQSWARMLPCSTYLLT